MISSRLRSHGKSLEEALVPYTIPRNVPSVHPLRLHAPPAGQPAPPTLTEASEALHREGQSARFTPRQHSGGGAIKGKQRCPLSITPWSGGLRRSFPRGETLVAAARLHLTRPDDNIHSGSLLSVIPPALLPHRRSTLCGIADLAFAGTNLHEPQPVGRYARATSRQPPPYNTGRRWPLLGSTSDVVHGGVPPALGRTLHTAA